MTIARRYGSRLYCEAEVALDVPDVLAEIDTDDLLAELETRGKNANAAAVGYMTREYAERALEALHRKNYAEAIALLDRALFPYPTPDVVENYLKELPGLPAAAAHKG